MNVNQHFTLQYSAEMPFAAAPAVPAKVEQSARASQAELTRGLLYARLQTRGRPRSPSVRPSKRRRLPGGEQQDGGPRRRGGGDDKRAPRACAGHSAAPASTGDKKPHRHSRTGGVGASAVETTTSGGGVAHVHEACDLRGHRARWRLRARSAHWALSQDHKGGRYLIGYLDRRIPVARSPASTFSFRSPGLRAGWPPRATGMRSMPAAPVASSCAGAPQARRARGGCAHIVRSLLTDQRMDMDLPDELPAPPYPCGQNAAAALCARSGACDYPDCSS